MKHYAVYFNGYWPVGSVAVVQAESEQDATDKLWINFCSELQQNNIKKDFTVFELTQECEILLDGNY